MSSRFEEVHTDDEKSKKGDKKPKAESVAPASTDSKKRKAETQDAAASPASKSEGKKMKNVKGEAVTPPSATKEKVEQPKKADKKEDKVKENGKPQQTSAKKVTLPSGLVMEDVKIGDGPVAGKGKRCGMR